MKVYDLDILKRNENNDNLYDLTEITFQLVQNITLPYFVEPEDEMRIENISNKIYGTTEYTDVLLNLNDIDNPLNIKSGDTLIYVDQSYIKSLRISSEEAVSKVKQFINTSKSTKVDTSRSQYVNDNFATIPTIQTTPKQQVKIQGSIITIGDVRP